MAEDEATDGGVLGNLPRSRPGRRSEKRTGGPAKAAGAAASKAEATGSPAAKATGSRAGRTAPASTPKGRARPKPAAGPRRQPEDPPREEAGLGGDPVRGPVRTATKLAGTGVSVAGSLAREVLRRLPRP